MSFLKGKKTYIISILLAVIGIIKVISGDMTFIEFLNSPDLIIILNGLGLGFLRAGVTKLNESSID